MALKVRLTLVSVVLLIGLPLWPDHGRMPVAGSRHGDCHDIDRPGSGVVLCDDFEEEAIQAGWDVTSNVGAWPTSRFVRCGDRFGFSSRCAAWSNDLIFDGYWGFWGYDAWRPFPPQDEFYLRWYQYISDSYSWGTLEDKSLLLHDPAYSITAYLATNRNELPDVPHSGPGMPFVANYQDVDWPETGGQYTNVNRFQNVGNDIVLHPGRWYLFEWYIKLNTPGLADGVTMLWVDDATRRIRTQTLRMHHADMRWLTSTDVGKKFGFLRLTVYHQRCDGVPYTCPPNGSAILRQSHRWDAIVISRSRVGPIGSRPWCPPATTISQGTPQPGPTSSCPRPR